MIDLFPIALDRPAPPSQGIDRDRGIEIEGSRGSPSIDPDRDRGIDGFPLTLQSIEIEEFTGSPTPDRYPSILGSTTPVKIILCKLEDQV